MWSGRRASKKRKTVLYMFRPLCSGRTHISLTTEHHPLRYGSPAVGPAELLKGPPKKHRARIILCHDKHISLAERRLLHAVHAVTAQDTDHVPEQSQH